MTALLAAWAVLSKSTEADLYQRLDNRKNHLAAVGGGAATIGDLILFRATVPRKRDEAQDSSLPMDSPGTEASVELVRTSNISRLVLSAHILAGSATSPMLAIARTSFDGFDADREVDSPALNSTFVACPIREPSAPKKLTCTLQGAS